MEAEKTMLIILLMFLSMPFLVYFAMKLGTSGYLRAKELFEERKKEARKTHKRFDIYN